MAMPILPQIPPVNAPQKTKANLPPAGPTTRPFETPPVGMDPLTRGGPVPQIQPSAPGPRPPVPMPAIAPVNAPQKTKAAVGPPALTPIAPPPVPTPGLGPAPAPPVAPPAPPVPAPPLTAVEIGGVGPRRQAALAHLYEGGGGAPQHRQRQNRMQVAALKPGGRPSGPVNPGRDGYWRERGPRGY